MFLSHNSQDKVIVRQLAKLLAASRVRVWLDEWELQPGQPWQFVVESIIETTKSAAVLVGPEGFGPWEVPEMRACLEQFVRRKLPVIPVLLPNTAVRAEELPVFLRGLTYVDMSSGITREQLQKLIWGITGRKPQKHDERTEHDKSEGSIVSFFVSYDRQNTHWIDSRQTGLFTDS